MGGKKRVSSSKTNKTNGEAKSKKLKKLINDTESESDHQHRSSSSEEEPIIEKEIIEKTPPPSSNNDSEDNESDVNEILQSTRQRKPRKKKAATTTKVRTTKNKRGGGGKRGSKKNSKNNDEEIMKEELADDDDGEEGKGDEVKVSNKSKKKEKKVEIKLVDEKPEENGNATTTTTEAETTTGGGESAGTYKKIRKIMGRQNLSEATKTAESLEKERRKRLHERQNKYNEVVVQSSSDSGELCPVTTKLVLEFDANTNEPLIEVSQNVIKCLKPHQVEAVKFLWECVIEDLKEHKKCLTDKDYTGRGGAIIAHCMGLGKTLSVITFLHTLFRHYDILKMKSAIIVCPVNTVLNWVREWNDWIPKGERLPIYELSSTRLVKERMQIIVKWQAEGGILIMGYDMFRILAQCIRIRRKIDRDRLQSALLNPGPDLIVLDEGHLIKNEGGRLSQIIRQIHTRRRIVLTGTPLQNNLNEYHTMVDFVKPQLLGNKKEFRNRFVNPIINGQHSTSTPLDVRVMKMRAHVLYKMLDGCVQRKDYSALTKYLPPKMEYLIRIRLTDVQRQLYQRYLDMRDRIIDVNNIDPTTCSSGAAATSNNVVNRLFTDQQVFYRIWTHPFTLRMHELQIAKKNFLKDMIDDEEDEESSAAGVSSDDDFYSSNSSSEGETLTTTAPAAATTTTTTAGSRMKKKQVINSSSSEQSEENGNAVDDVDEEDKSKTNHHHRHNNNHDVEPTTTTTAAATTSSSTVVNHRWATRSRRDALNSNSLDENLLGNNQFDELATIPPAWWHDIYDSSFEYRPELSGKIIMMFHLLRKCANIGDKVLLFSQSLYSLDIIEKYLGLMHRYMAARNLKNEDNENISVNNNNNSSSSPTSSSIPTTTTTISSSSSSTLHPVSTTHLPTTTTTTSSSATTSQSLEKDKEDLFDYTQFQSDIGPNTWIKGVDYDRMDGSTAIHLRKDIQDSFNNPDNLRFRLFLISTRAGGLGINLVSANRVIIFDASWNPSHDIQSIFRSYRFGQCKPVFIYRLVSQGTMEEKIYDRQITKQSLSRRVIDEQQIDRHFSAEDLQALYTFEPDIYDVTKPKEKTPIVPRDLLLADLLMELPQWISSYHDHDSLLENKTEEELTEEERQEAWKHYEEEKRVGFAMVAGVNNPGGGGGNANANINRLAEIVVPPQTTLWPPGFTSEGAQQLYSHVAWQVYHAFPDFRDDPVRLTQLVAQFYQQAILQYMRQSAAAMPSTSSSSAAHDVT